MSEDTDKDALPELTGEQMAFVDSLIRGKNATDAYLAAYPHKKSWQPASIWSKASALKNSDKIQAWLQAAREAQVGNAATSLATHLLELDRLKHRALAQNNISAAIQAEHLRGKAAGLYVEKTETVTKPDPRAVLDKIAQTNPELAQELANRKGIAWDSQQETIKTRISPQNSNS